MTEFIAPKGMLFDVEGTTTPITFVHDVLFPFARQRLAIALAQIDREEIAQAHSALNEEWANEDDAEKPASFGDGVAYCQYLMDRDRKSTGLKALQGHIWHDGYRNGELIAPLFDDVAPALRRWHVEGRSLKIYSSGSILAQRLLFAHSSNGDLTPLLDGYHDTTTGPKRDANSYAAIAAAWGLDPKEILFFSDIPEELDAARDAGVLTQLVIRPGNAPTTRTDHPRIATFADVR